MSEITISSVFGAIIALSYLLLTGYSFGRGLLASFREPWRTLIGAGISLSLLAILGSAVYYLTDVTMLWLALELIAVAAIAFALGHKAGISPRMISRALGERILWIWRTRGHDGVMPLQRGTLFVLGLVSLGAWWTAVLTHPVTESVRTPWDVLSPFSLVALFVPFLLSLLLFTYQKEEGITATFPCGQILFILTLFSGLSMAAVLYPLGFGFDPFLHRATVAHIADFGTITPKPLYYIGQYALEILGAKFFRLPLFTLDVFLAPLLAAVLLPAAIFGRSPAKGLATPKPYGAVTVLAVLPFAAFVSTTPQALSFIFAGVAIFLCAFGGAVHRYASAKPLRAPMIFALAALFTHPLSGAIVVLYVILVAVAQRFSMRLRGGLTVALLALISITLPLAFTLQSLKAGLPLGFSLPTSLSELSGLTLFFSTNWNAWGDVAYFIIGNLFIILFAAAIILFFKKTDRSLSAALPLLAGIACVINFLILSLFFNFTYLISYERSDFALRALTLATLFFVPYVTRVWPQMTDEWVWRRQTPAALVIALVFVANVYGAYPRNDNYARSSGFNVSETDFSTVSLIDTFANGAPYAVLSNQATSSAAIETFGFKTYYHGDIFFYPIPTGGPLYTLFLEMNEKPSLETIEKVRALTGVQTVFYVVSNYWWQSESIKENTKPLAKAAVELNDATVFVFLSP
jgi:hypothetical protein